MDSDVENDDSDWKAEILHNMQNQSENKIVSTIVLQGFSTGYKSGW